jgi:GNAT superfamily N-acetyltransferase
MVAAVTDPTIPEEYRRTPEEMAQWQLPHRFFETHRDPNVMVGAEMRANQEYRNPHVVTAQAGETSVGYFYTAENVSGSGLARAVKWHMQSKRYVWAWEIAVAPEVRRQGVGTTLVMADLLTRDRHSDLTAYTWPQLLPDVASALEKRGFEVTDTTQDQPFPAPPRVDQTRSRANIGMLRRDILPYPEPRRKGIRRGLTTIDNQLPGADK